MHKPWLSFYEAGVPLSLSYPDVPLDTILTRAADTHPDDIATHFVLKYMAGGRLVLGGKYTYRQLNEQVNRLATALYQLGVRKGDRVGLMVPNSPQFVIAFFAVLRIGAILVTINPTYTSREIKHQLVDSGTETLILLNLFWPRLREIQSSTPLKRVIVSAISDTLDWPTSLLVHTMQRRQKDWVQVEPEHDIFFFQHLLQKYGPLPPHTAVNPDDVALFQYTGGTTGTPKAAMLTHRNLMANLTQIIAWIPNVQPGQDSLLGAIPFFHAYGMMAGMLYALRMRCPLVIIPNPRQMDHLLQVIQYERCSLLPGVPALYMGISNHTDARTYNMSSVRICISGAASLSPEIQQRFEALTGGRLVEGYGLSEASPVTHCNPVNGIRKPGIGVPLPDVEARLIDLEDGTVLPLTAGQTGELCVRGPQLMQGYWNQPEDTARTIDAEGWLHTGDICQVDEDGFFTLVDRKKDIIIVGGFKVLPHDVEEVLRMHPAVQDAAVAGIPRPERGDETVKAYIVAQPGSQPTAADILAFCKLHLAPYKLPRQIEFRTDLPRTIVGKVLRRMLVTEEQQAVAH